MFSRKKNAGPFTAGHFNAKNIHIGDYTYGIPAVKDWGEGASLYIGKFCSIADQVAILLGGNHRTDWVSTYPFMAFNDHFPAFAETKGHPATKGDIKIGNDVWIGTGVTILSGVTIGDGAVIAAHAVVSKNIPPYAIAAGNPAVVAKYRFSGAAIEKLLKIKWWDWDKEKINEHANLICHPDIEKFIARFNTDRP